MRILVTGATGFIGRHVVAALTRAGHQVVPLSRQGPEAHRLDFEHATRVADWLPHLDGIDAVINTVGIFRESGTRTFRRIHVDAPHALFTACVYAGVRRVVQVSALGADADALTPYHLSKREADDDLLSLPLHATVVQPSLVFGPGGTSARLFGAWATLPMTPLPGAGDQAVQPIHIDDLSQAIAALVASCEFRGARVPLVGPQPLAMREFIATLRGAMGLAPSVVLRVPRLAMQAAARLAAPWPGSLLDRDALSMLERGNVADPRATGALLGRAPRPAEQFVTPAERPAATLAWALPLLRWSVALVWIVTGILSWGVYPESESQQLLARLGLVGATATVLLYGAATLDVLLGLAMLAPRRVPGLWSMQVALIASYTALITVWLPEYWLHPFGPILKNLPMLAAIAMLAALENRPRWTT